MKLMGTSSTPSRAVAKPSTTNSQQLCDSSARRSPLAMPAASSAAAVRLMTASSSAKVSRVSPSTTASLSGKRFAVRRGRSPSAWCRASAMGDVDMPCSLALLWFLPAGQAKQEVPDDGSDQAADQDAELRQLDRAVVGEGQVGHEDRHGEPDARGRGDAEQVGLAHAGGVPRHLEPD